jgi:hypothetical protein
MYLEKERMRRQKLQNSVDTFSANQVKGRSTLGTEGRNHHVQRANPCRYASVVLTPTIIIQ